MAVKPFKKITNFRDIGGLPTEDGRVMKTGILFRSGEPSRLTAHDLEKLNALNLKLICDLRTPNERKSRIMPTHQNRTIRVVNIPISQHEEDYTRFAFFMMMMKSAKTIDLEKMMKDFYRRIAFESMPQIREVITLFGAENDVPALIHCADGKDRTGVIVALIQLLAGVPRDAVMADYMLSNSLTEARMKRAAAFLRYTSLFRLTHERLKPLLQVRRDYLEEVLDELICQYGSVEAYLNEGCGISEYSLHKMKDLLLRS
ncbi:tyrosine-protein phosphatase [Paenibacillus dendritiformis]|uniref:tyrosine-protein phosphatase n=1 Tax=Paenibacillus dendritiformis TaxID=130049 RepID=UPI001F5561F3|nr:tyrosine-protein phosphatase [Paenibacillus dendritiformis]